jgi:hypothetical protein
MGYWMHTKGYGKQILLLILIFGLIYAWLCVDQLFIPKVVFRFLALAVMSLVLLTFYFFIVKPSEPMKLAALCIFVVSTRQFIGY